MAASTQLGVIPSSDTKVAVGSGHDAAYADLNVHFLKSLA